MVHFSYLWGGGGTGWGALSRREGGSGEGVNRYIGCDGRSCGYVHGFVGGCTARADVPGERPARGDDVQGVELKRKPCREAQAHSQKGEWDGGEAAPGRVPVKQPHIRAAGG